MPRYQYRCENCGHEMDVKQRMRDAALTDCPVCEESALRRVINRIGVVFKGSGFYVTDNRSSAKSTRGESKSNGKTEAAATSDSKSDSSSDSKASTKSSPAPAKTAENK